MNARDKVVPGCTPFAVVDKKTGKVITWGFACGMTPRFAVPTPPNKGA